MTQQAVKGAVLLAAGRGKRLRPYTDTTPKPLLPVNGQPTLDLYFQGLREAGVEDAVLVTHHLAEQVQHYASAVQPRYGIRCTTVHQPVLDGTASALESVMREAESKSAGSDTQSLCERVLSSSFLLMATDYLIPSDFIANLIAFHQSHAHAVSASLKKVPEAELALRSSVRFNQAGQLVEIVEKPAAGTAPSEYSANLAFVLPSEVQAHIQAVEPSPRGEREVQSAINAYLANGGGAMGLIQPTPYEWQPSQT